MYTEVNPSICTRVYVVLCICELSLQMGLKQQKENFFNHKNQVLL